MGTFLLLVIGAAVLLTLLVLIVRRLRSGRPLLYPFIRNDHDASMKVYLDIDGTLIHEDLGPNYGKPAAGLADFVRALRPYDVYWLTTHCRDNDPVRAREIVKRVLPEELHADIDRIKPVVWDMMKTEALDWESDFIWFDNDIFDEERAAFANALPTQQFIEVDLRQNPDQLIEITRDVLEN